jgi:two-component sensor histidine kinase
MNSVIEISAVEPASSEEHLLLREFTHRANNEFASAISILALAAARSASDEVKAALATAQDRLQNYARVQHALQMPDHDTFIDATAYLRQLCRAISRSKLDCKGIELVFVERPLSMNSERSWRLGMIVSELITNAARHAFNERKGVIRVELSLPRRQSSHPQILKTAEINSRWQDRPAFWTAGNRIGCGVSQEPLRQLKTKLVPARL